jgi:predicted MPP superfamily phosphohydrolase
MKRLFGSWIFILVMLSVDFYVFQSLRLVTAGLPQKTRLLIHGFYWSFSVIAVLLFLFIPVFGFESIPRFIRTYVFAIVVGFFIAKIVASIFFLVDDLRRVLQWGGTKAIDLAKGNGVQSGEGISRSIFLSWLGVGVGSGLFGTLLYGFGNKYKYKVEKRKVAFSNLPDKFKGLKIIHISDIHSGSLEDKKAVAKGVEKIMELKPDIVFFTGDLVNNISTEMDPLVEVFSGIQAPMGVYSILGNHDYGDYFQWSSKEEKSQNLDRLKSIHAQMGWKLLLNENVTLEKEGASIGLIGVENWGAKANFSRYGDLKKAYAGVEQHQFKILLSHDPSHWDAEVCKHYGDIDLMLSGHTHGMQFGVEIPGFRWSPVQYVYKQWSGLYTNGNQKLYVNRGFGFLGYPGRVGMLPEITLLELA